MAGFPVVIAAKVKFATHIVLTALLTSDICLSNILKYRSLPKPKLMR